jgi:hypothetical protein
MCLCVCVCVCVSVCQVCVPTDTTVALPPYNLAATSLPQLSSASEHTAVATVHTCLFRYCVNCYNNSVLLIYLLAN